MNKHILFRILAGLVILAAIAGIAAFSFRAGMMNAAALNLPTDGTELRQFGPNFGHGFSGMPYGRHGGFFNPFGFLKCLIPLFLLFLVFGFFRRMMWGRHMMHGFGHGPWGHHGEGSGVPPMFDEWHRRAHEKPAEKPVDAPADPANQPPSA